MTNAAPGSLSGPQTIVLSMIVKNEAHVIRRCLGSVRPFLTHWAICDTGSTDGTQDVIREVMADIPGRLIERPWVDDFAHSRNQALDLALETGATYALFIDADDTVEAVGEPEPLKELGAGLVAVRYECSAETPQVPTFIRPFIVPINEPRYPWAWRFAGAVHEEVQPTSLDAPAEFGILSGYRVVIRQDGGASRAGFEQKVRGYAAIAKSNVDSPFACFQWARTSVAAGEWRDVLDATTRLMPVLGELEVDERYVLLAWRAVALAQTGRQLSEIGQAFKLAHDVDPTRAEAPRWLARILEARGAHPDKVRELHAQADALTIREGKRYVEPSAYRRAATTV